MGTKWTKPRALELDLNDDTVVREHRAVAKAAVRWDTHDEATACAHADADEDEDHHRRREHRETREHREHQDEDNHRRATEHDSSNDDDDDVNVPGWLCPTRFC